MLTAREDWLVMALSAAGIFFMVLGLLALALPTAQEGVQLWQLDHQHAIYTMDVAGTFVLGLGLVMTWLGGKLWNHHLLA